MEEEDGYLAMLAELNINPKTFGKTVVDKIQKSYTHRLDGRWTWCVIVWKHETMSASFTINGVGCFKNKSDADRDMTKTLELLNLVQKPKKHGK